MAHRADLGWPMYFAKRSLRGRALTVEAGQPFPFQDKPTIRALGANFDVSNAMTCPFGELPYVEVVDVGSIEQAKEIERRGLGLKDVKKMLGQAAGG